MKVLTIQPPGGPPDIPDGTGEVIEFVSFRGHTYMPSKLKGTLVRHGISQTKLAAAVLQANGVPLSDTSMSQAINRGYFPKGTPEGDIRRQVEAFLAGRGVPAAEIACCWESEPGEDAYRSIPPRGTHLPKVQTSRAAPTVETDMLLRAEPLSPAARKGFGVGFRNPFGNEIEAEEDVFLWPDFRYCREALWSAAMHGAFRAIVGESGSGKTTLREDLIDRIRQENSPVVLIEPYVVGMEDSDTRGRQLKSMQIAESVIRSLAPHSALRQTPDARYRQAHELLIESSRTGYRHLLLIEEAHSLPPVTLKHLKRWREMKDGKRMLLGIALIGQPELKVKLDERNPMVREVVQRCELVELLDLGTSLEAYLEHRLARVGKKLEEVFEAGAAEAIRARLTFSGRTAVSMLYPLAVNNLCTRAMNLAARVGDNRITADAVKGA